MPASLAFVPASGSVTAKVSAVKVTVAGLDQNDDTAYDALLYPASPELTYYVKFSLGGNEMGRSYVFSTDENGSHVFNNYVFSEAGTWTVTLHNADTNAQVATASVVVA
jgi:hypothetical protein